MIEGIVTKSTGSWYLVEDRQRNQYTCRIIGKFRLKGFKLTNPVAVGDKVMIDCDSDEEKGKAIIKEILPRKNYVVRQSPRKKHFLHLLAANIDQAVLLVTMVQPMLKLGFIDRFLVMTEPYNIPVTIIFNKKDLYNSQNLERFEQLKDLYSSIGYNIHLISATEAEDISLLKELLQSKTSLIAGQSGVGKSTIVNKLLDNNHLKTSEISLSSGKGQHTTTFAEMYSLDNNTKIIDTPGIKTLSFNNFEVMDVAHSFKEFFAYSKDCKFSDCTHRNEPACAVKEAIEEGEISIFRYENYLQILDEIEDQNYWERLKNM